LVVHGGIVHFMVVHGEKGNYLKLFYDINYLCQNKEACKISI
jgi:hypothetical protein